MNLRCMNVITDHSVSPPGGLALLELRLLGLVGFRRGCHGDLELLRWTVTEGMSIATALATYGGDGRVLGVQCAG